jgi:outer membrane lipoprotein-sorting protein
MIRKLLVGAGLASVVVAAAIVVDAGHLATYVNKINSAEGLEVNYSINEVGGAQTKYRVVLAKPNKALIETPAKTYVADGKNLTVYDRKMNSYFIKPQPDNIVKELFADEEVSLWQSFFDAKAFDKVTATKNEGTVKRRGETLNTVSAQVDKSGEYTIRLHLSQKDGLIRQAELVTGAGATQKTRIVNVESITTSKPADTLFAFTAPANSKQLTEADMIVADWSTDLGKALTSAAALGRGVMIDFYADW